MPRRSTDSLVPADGERNCFGHICLACAAKPGLRPDCCRGSPCCSLLAHAIRVSHTDVGLDCAGPCGSASGTISTRRCDRTTGRSAHRDIYSTKTGTLSCGQCEVVQCEIEDGECHDAVLTVAAQLAGASNHPISRTISQYVVAVSGHTTAEGYCTRNIPGRGVIGTAASNSNPAVLGNELLLSEMQLTTSELLPQRKSMRLSGSRNQLYVCRLGRKSSRRFLDRGRAPPGSTIGNPEFAWV